MIQRKTVDNLALVVGSALVVVLILGFNSIRPQFTGKATIQNDAVSFVPLESNGRFDPLVDSDNKALSIAASIQVMTQEFSEIVRSLEVLLVQLALFIFFIYEIIQVLRKLTNGRRR